MKRKRLVVTLLYGLLEIGFIAVALLYLDGTSARPEAWVVIGYAFRGLIQLIVGGDEDGESNTLDR